MKDRDYPIGKPIGVIEHCQGKRFGHYVEKNGTVIIRSENDVSQFIMFKNGRGIYRTINGHYTDDELKYFARKMIKDYTKK